MTLKLLFFGMWIVLEIILLILLSRAQNKVEPTMRMFPIFNSRKEFDIVDDDRNYIFEVRITIPTKTSSIASISRWINFSLKNTTAKRIENKTSPLISIDESEAELFERP